MPKIINVNDLMQTNYTYELKAKSGDISSMKNALSPKEMLQRGIFSGKYLNDCKKELPKSWFTKAKVTGVDLPPDSELNEFKIKSRLSLKEWRKRKWIIGNDPRGWFQWYCRYYRGRREPIIDEKQIKRFWSFKRHAAQLHKAAVKENRVGDPTFRPRQRQALLQWAWDPFIDKYYK